ncbi:MAG: hypothetical protein AAGF95_17655 [Chloroflexota bacterium]
MLGGGVAGGVGFLMGPWASAAFGGGLRSSLIAGALEGSLTDGAMQLTINWASGRTWHHNLGWSLLGGGLAGGVGGGIGWKWGPNRRAHQAATIDIPTLNRQEQVKVIRAGETAGGQNFRDPCQDESCRVAQAKVLRVDFPDDGTPGRFNPLYQRYGTDAYEQHYAVRNPDGTITDTTILQNIAGHSGGRTDITGLSKEFPKLKQLAPYDTFDPEGYDILLDILHQLHIRKHMNDNT